MTRWSVVYERTSTGRSAYVPALPGLGVAGAPGPRSNSSYGRASHSTSKVWPKMACRYRTRTALRLSPSPSNRAG